MCKGKNRFTDNSPACCVGITHMYTQRVHGVSMTRSESKNKTHIFSPGKKGLLSPTRFQSKYEIHIFSLKNEFFSPKMKYAL